MQAVTTHRGPDHAGETHFLIRDARVFMGANRLKIHDVTKRSNQPFQDSGGRYSLVFNGEIYNYYDLKNELIQEGCVFRTSSDTEVLLNWLIKKGRQGIENLSGMFAFVFSDRELGIVLAARDQWGMKPLFYTHTESQIVISSELRGVLASGLVERRLNRNQVAHYLQYKYAGRPETFYEHVFEMEPGCSFVYEDGKVDIDAFLNTSGKSKEMEPGAGSTRFSSDVERLLRSSLVTHLQSDVPVGLLLSGGVDSTLLLALAREEGYTMPSFSIVNRKSDASYGTEDYKYARMAAGQFRSEHEVMEVDDAILKGFYEFVEQLDQPVADSGAWMTYLICKKASDSVKVVISGAGADELFGGYNRHWAFNKYLQHRKALMALLPAIRLLGPVLPDGGIIPMRKQLRLFKKWALSLDEDPGTTWNRMIGMPEFMVRQKMDFWPEKPDLRINMNFALEHDRSQYLISDVLAVSDRMSMRNSLEMRLPYLDDTLTDFIRNIEPEYLLSRGGKTILKEILNTYGGKKFTARKKEGFGLPIGNWFKNKKHDYLWELYSEDGHLIFDFVKREKILGLIKTHRRGTADLSQELWSILVLGNWLAKEFE